MQIGDDAGEHMDRIDRRAAENPRMQIAVGGMDHHFLEHEAAQHDGDRGRLPVPHSGVADKRHIGFEFGRVGGKKGRKRRRAGFLLAFDEECDMAGQIAGFLEGAAGFDEGHELTLVVGDAAPDDPLAGFGLDEARLEGRAFPTNRAGPAAGRRNGRKRADAARPGAAAFACPTIIGWPGVGRTEASKPMLLSSAGEPFGRLGALARIGGVGRDRRNFDELEEPPKGGVEIGIDFCQDRVERRHKISL